MKNSKNIPFDDLCNLIANEIDGYATPNSVKRCLIATYKVILRQLKLHKKIKFRSFGTFFLRERKSGERLANDINGNNKNKIIYVAPRTMVKFKPSEIFTTSINENNYELADSLLNKKIKDNQNKKTSKYGVVSLLNTAQERANNYGKTKIRK